MARQFVPADQAAALRVSPGPRLRPSVASALHRFRHRPHVCRPSGSVATILLVGALRCYRGATQHNCFAFTPGMTSRESVHPNHPDTFSAPTRRRRRRGWRSRCPPTHPAGSVVRCQALTPGPRLLGSARHVAATPSPAAEPTMLTATMPVRRTMTRRSGRQTTAR